MPIDKSRLTEPDIIFKLFVVDLLKCRMLFDRYIIKRQNDDGWVLKTLKPYDKSFKYEETFEQETKSLVMILSMFHVSYPTQVYKHWLCATLRYLFRCDQPEDFTHEKYQDFLESLSYRFLLELFGKGAKRNYDTLTFEDTLPKVEFDASNLEKGTGIQSFIFNRLDYLLWKGLQSNGDNLVSQLDHTGNRSDYLKYVQDRAKAFSFTFRSSVEHYYPQNPKAGANMEEKLLHSFGNLCLISHSENSRANNDLPVQKKKLYEGKPSESLKLGFMMAYPNWEAESENVITEHERANGSSFVW